MRNKEMSMNDYRVMYAEYCLEAGASYSTMAVARGLTKFIAWRKRKDFKSFMTKKMVEKYFENRPDSS